MSKALKALAATAVLTLTGCPGDDRGAEIKPIFLPMPDAVARVNRQNSKLSGGLQARGSVTIRFVESGRSRRLDLDGNLQFLAPRSMRFALSAFGQEKVLCGSNAEQYWLGIRPEVDTYWWGRYDNLALADPSARPPLRPDQIIEALGILPLPEDSTGEDGPVYRVDEKTHQLIYVHREMDGALRITKEYWLSRRDPFLIERIIFRDDLGRIIMDAALGNYKPLGGEGPMAAHDYDIRWPTTDAQLIFHINNWRERPYAHDHPQFEAPHERGIEFGRMIDLDEEPM